MFRMPGVNLGDFRICRVMFVNHPALNVHDESSRPELAIVNLGLLGIRPSWRAARCAWDGIYPKACAARSVSD